MNRRTFLRNALISGSVLAIQPSLLLPGASARVSLARWSDPKTWGGSVPGENDVVVVSKPILLDVNAKVAGVQIKRGGRLVFHPDRSVALFSSGNVVVKGRLVMKPATPRKRHRLVFVDVDESRFQGGGMDVLPSDVGLWVMHHGRLDLRGSRRLSWTRAVDDIAKGASVVKLQEDPVGWRVGDELAITPTLKPTHPDHSAYDYARIRSIDGRRVTLSKPTSFAHPAVKVAPRKIFPAEILNLTRNVRIEGTSKGRSHVLIHSMHPQNIRYVALRDVGPRRETTSGTTGVLGRYGLHFHHCESGSRGSTVVGVLVRDCGNHAFVAHESHGITFARCVSHDTMETAYWWDKPSSEDQKIQPRSNDITYTSCLASLVTTDGNAGRLAGFELGRGSDVVCRGCVAVGVRGEKSASGFHWPELRIGTEGIWLFENCVAHNNRGNGIFVWQNTPLPHRVEKFVGFHNSYSGINHGAYKNRYHYSDCTLYGNLQSAVNIPANSRDTENLRFSRMRCDAAGLSDHAVLTEGHSASSPLLTIIKDCTFLDYRKSAFGFLSDQSKGGNPAPDGFRVVNCRFDGNKFWLGDAINPESRILFKDGKRGLLQLSRWDQVLEGDYKAEWNARVKPL